MIKAHVQAVDTGSFPLPPPTALFVLFASSLMYGLFFLDDVNVNAQLVDDPRPTEIQESMNARKTPQGMIDCVGGGIYI